MPPIEPASTRVVLPLPDCEERRSAGRGRGTFGRILRAATAAAAVAIPIVGPIVSAVAAARRSGGGGFRSAIGGESETLQYLELQRAIEQETRMYEAASNVLKARHDATMSSIRNIKS